MNKTLSIGLAGFSFTIEEHAYIKLSDYLAALRNSLDVSEADEVMHDIEIRMVEIFKDALGKREVINDLDVDRVIAQIGSPEKIEEQEEAYFSEKTSNTKREQRSSANFSGQKQLFRDPEHEKIAGVCAGIAHYVGMDISAMRAIWLGIAVLGVFTAAISTSLIILIYVILWIVLPRAENATDFLKMKGKPMNFDNLKEESTKIVQFANESTQKVGELYNENKPYINKAGNGLWAVVRYFLGAILGMIGLSLLVGSFAILGFGFSGAQNINFFSNLGFYLQDSNLGFIVIALSFLSAFIPGLIFSYLAIKLFSPKTKFNNTGYVIGALVFVWIGLVAATGFSAIKFKSQYSGTNDDIANVAINTTSDSILIDLKKVEIPQNFKSYWDNVYSDGKTIYKQDYPRLDVTRKDVKAPYLEIKKRADGYNLPMRVNVPLEIINNKITLPNYFSYPYTDRFRDYRVDYELIIPKNMKVISLNDERGFSVDDDQYNDTSNSSTNTNISEDDDSVTVNSGGNSIVVPSSNADSIIVNGKKVGKKEAELIIKKMRFSSDDVENVDISIKNGKKEISIKTK
ncbi:PspC domain-containing protein [Kaistella antarctica]|uniref:DNA-binding transcriptional activator PspC n=1 Tax=Kaistella antarctica TaxID=266748 RepID=A0A448NV22_9FLAO|nr:PspC domain-containing protein [Kaistella antarctica]KEY20247.1 phage-shock protein [Kaistella antarctica]SEV91885.1 phage shock protein C (PspC) family protein [Kaistella antarctica]VEI01666.1 DNA-binding transcriptional activator PspC [Kaistella antarctica]